MRSCSAEADGPSDDPAPALGRRGRLVLAVVLLATSAAVPLLGLAVAGVSARFGSTDTVTITVSVAPGTPTPEPTSVPTSSPTGAPGGAPVDDGTDPGS